MMRTAALKADIRLITREPVLVLFSLMPISIAVLFKVLAAFVLPQVQRWIPFSVSDYYGYWLAMTFLLTPGMLGTVAGFLMLDERDAGIYALMSITPTGYIGYITHRLAVPFCGGIIYTLLGYYIVEFFPVRFPVLLMVGVECGLLGAAIGLLLFGLAEDKVQGLTYSKALSAFTVLAAADVIRVPWVSMAAAFTPFYWITRLIHQPHSLYAFAMSAGVTVLWMVFSFYLWKRSIQ